jgi:hypothetical protein
VLVTSDTSGNIIVVGDFTGSVVLGGATLTGSSYVARFSPTGSVLDAFSLPSDPTAVAAIGGDVLIALSAEIRRSAWDGTTIWSVPLTNLTTNELVVSGTSILAVGGVDSSSARQIGTRTLSAGALAWIARLTSTGTVDRVGDFAVGSFVVDEGGATGLAARSGGTFIVAGEFQRYVALPGLYPPIGSEWVRGGYFVEVAFP